MSKETIEICPLCGSRMEKGFIATGGGRPIFWNKTPLKSHLRYVLSGIPREWDTIIPLSSQNLRNIEAYRCRKCNLVIFKYGKAGNPAEKSDEDGT